MPFFTMSVISCALNPWCETPESVPRATGTPSCTAVRNVFASEAAACNAFSATRGGSFFSRARRSTFSTAIKVGTYTTPRRFISVRVSGFRNDPCSMESTPAAMAILAAASPWQWAAAFLRHRCASSTMAAVSSAVSCGTSTGSLSESTPPDTANLITSAPYLSCQRTASRH